MQPTDKRQKWDPPNYSCGTDKQVERTLRAVAESTGTYSKMGHFCSTDGVTDQLMTTNSW